MARPEEETTVCLHTPCLQIEAEHDTPKMHTVVGRILAVDDVTVREFMTVCLHLPCQQIEAMHDMINKDFSSA